MSGGAPTSEWEDSLNANFQHIRTRCIELSLACDPVLRDLSRFWDMHLGNHRNLIRLRIQELGMAPENDELIEQLVECLGSNTARNGCFDAIDRRVERLVIETYCDRNGTTELRCECCGYHFRSEDVNPRRRAVAEDAGLVLAEFIDPRRLEDDLKPVSREGKDRFFLQLELDHVVPRLGLGASTKGNLRLLCAFCNLGKTHYKYPGEAIAECISASASLSFGTTASATWIARTAVNAILTHSRSSQLSSANYCSTELTVRFRSCNDRDSTGSDWLVPWNLQVLSYEDF